MLVEEPGYLTRDSSAEQVTKAVQRFAKDDLLYGQMRDECHTCKIKKAARSKHCSRCDMCVEKYDHHSIWFNKCIGLHNYVLYLQFLLVHVVAGFYLKA